MGMGQTRAIDPQGIPRAEVPYFILVDPAAAVAAAATAVVNMTMPPRDFVWTHMGFTSADVGIPAAGPDFRIRMRDVGASIDFTPGNRFRIRAITGTNAGTSDKGAFELSKPWRFKALTTLMAEFENLGGIASTPHLVLHGYLD